MSTRGRREAGEAAWFAAFAHNPRLAMLRALASGRKTVDELAAAVGMHQANVSFHVKMLERLGIVTTQRAGIFKFCSLSSATVGPEAMVITHPSGLTVTLPLG